MAPGFIDTHVHVESSMVVPAEFERGVLPCGTTTAICDPHEIANVVGIDGIRYFIEASRQLVMTLRVNLSSCVPATALETAGARLEAEDLAPLLSDPAVIGLAELMNFPGVIHKDPGMLAKLEQFFGEHIDGHSPLLRASELNAYLAVGVSTDHECTSLAEAEEKLAKGMHILLREGSIAKNVTTLAPLVTDATWMRCAFCTDDRNPLEIREEGHIDHAMRLAIRAGAPAIPVYRAATLGAATAFGLRDRGIVAPGKRADLVILDDLDERPGGRGDHRRQDGHGGPGRAARAPGPARLWQRAACTGRGRRPRPRRQPRGTSDRRPALLAAHRPSRGRARRGSGDRPALRARAPRRERQYRPWLGQGLWTAPRRHCHIDRP